MADQRPRVAIVGAGPSGLAAAHHLADSHRVWLFDSCDTIGGVWAASSDQAYSWLETNTPTALFPFPGFPMVASDWDNEEASGSKKRPPYVSGRTAQRYYTRFAREKRLNEQGRLEGLRVRTKVIQIKRENDKERNSGSLRWLVITQDVTTGKQETLLFKRIILATGSFSTPFIPNSLQPCIKGGIFAFHSGSLASSQVVSRLSHAQQIVIVGGGKSALDLVAHLKRSSASNRPSIILILPRHKQPSAWPLPHGSGPSFLSRLPLLGAGYLSPWAGSSLSSTTGWLERSRFGRAFRRYYWSALTRYARSTFSLLFPSSASHTSPWRDILRSTSRLFPAPAGLVLAGEQAGLSIFFATINNVSTDENHKEVSLCIDLSDGSTRSIVLDGQRDLLIACTGYLSPASQMTSLFADQSEAEKLGIPTLRKGYQSESDDEWHRMIEGAVRRARREVPLLSEIFSEEEMFAEHLDTYRLYHHMIPIEQSQASVKETIPHDFAVVGLPQTISAAVVADVQARWLSQLFAEEDRKIPSSLRLPSCQDEAKQETAGLVAASISRYGPRDARQGTTMALELAWYADLLLSDMKKVSQKRKGLLYPLRALSSDDFL